MKKKIIALTVAAVLLVMASISGTYAYLKDTDGAKNVMVTGNVTIAQYEKDREGNDFVDNQKLLPAVYDESTWSYDGKDYTGGDIFANSVKGEIDKIVTIENTGTEAAFIRTIVLMENTADNYVAGKIHGLWATGDGQYRQWLTDSEGNDILVEIGGEKFSIAVCTYNTALPAGETSAPSLKQIFLDKSVGNEWFDLVNGKFDIYVFSQAVQAEGFTDVNEAFDASFGAVTAENVLDWFNTVNFQ